ncbi:MAG: tetratricopeptide repeat protein [Armatimonadia bacterium]|nr:tetratricopeptide repeat protein [Armatimonadia bacterium]
MHFRAALAANPNYVYALNNLGVVLEKQGDLTGALEQYRKALEVDPNYTSAKTNRDRIEKKLGEDAATG